MLELDTRIVFICIFKTVNTFNGIIILYESHINKQFNNNL